MKKFLSSFRVVRFVAILLLIAVFLHSNLLFAQAPATITIPVGIGNPCLSTSSDSLKYYNYNDVTNSLSHRWNCLPSLATPGFSDVFSTIQFNPFDGYLYFGRIISGSGGQYTTHLYRWLPTTCPAASTPIYQTFQNQLVVGIEFDPQTGYGYQLNFIDTTGLPALSYDATNNVGQYVSSAIINGKPASAHYDATNMDLHYSRANDVQGVSWAPAVKVATADNVGQYASLGVVSGFPAIAYYDATNLRLMYVRATNANGTTWGTPVVADDPAGTINVGKFASMVVVDGNPAIAYYDDTNDDLKYVRATNSTGTAWGTPIVLDAINNTGMYASMKIVSGNPAIAYHDGTAGDLRFIRAGNSTGSAWQAAVTVAATDSVGLYPSLEVINGNPAISYHNGTAQDLVYVRATNNTGTTWGTPLTLVTANNTGQFTSMTTVAGNPAIAYYDVTGADLQYIRATDVNGTAWAAELTPEAAGTVGQYANLIVADGHPAINYFEAGGNNARYIRAYDNAGVYWFANSKVFDMELQQVDFATNTLGPSRPINFGSRYIYKQNGDIVMTPGRQMLVAMDNKYFTINWQDYSTSTPLVATFIDTLKVGAGNDLVGLAYASGKLVASLRASVSCNSSHREIDILTGALSTVTSSDNFTSADMTNIPTGLGVAKRLASINAVSAGTYDVVYELVIRNYGGTPVANIQASDTLDNINGIANNISASITSFTGPAGITPNAAFDGKISGNVNLLTAGGTLSNIPGQNTITLRITCRVSGILPGIVYNNTASATGTNIFGDQLRDVSTNGANPDLNSNDKPDDVGENQPTPFLITVPAITPPCGSLVTVLYSQDFGTGTGLTGIIPVAVLGGGATTPGQTSLYSNSTTPPLPVDRYTVTNNATNANPGNFLSMTDHTGNANGRMLVINADAANTVMYRGAFFGSTCTNTQYSLSFYAAFPGNGAYQTICNAFGGFQYPRIKMRIRDGFTNLIITETSTADIIHSGWQQYGVRFVAPASYNHIIFELINDAPGGCGNDVVIDDIQFGTCDPVPVVSSTVASGCMGGPATFTATITDPGGIGGTVQYQWQVASAPAGPWANIPSATGSTYTIPAVAAADTGKYYRVLIAALGNINNANCRFASPGIILRGRLLSEAATGAIASKNNVCPLIQVGLSVVNGTLGYGAQWVWYANSCGIGTPVGVGASIVISAPFATTTYYVRAEGICNVTACQTVTVFISCNIDKDRDGVPDFAESYTYPVALTEAYNTSYAGFVDNNNDHINDNFQADGDSDGDGTPNYLDTDFPGRVNNNADLVDDRFDNDLDGIINMLDLDSDNDGIPDVVEAGGVDTDRDGKIDNYTDSDNDGLSQQVDGSNFGAMASGTGLGIPDLDADARPNAIDRDSDGDGIPDVVEVYGADINNNAIIDNFADINFDGLHDNFINATGLIRTGPDMNNDGRADSYPDKNFDANRRANPYDLDSDADGIADVIEAGLADANFNGMADGTIGTDGWSNTVRSLPAPLALLNSDGIGRPNYLDIDSDGDGIPDNIEGQSTLGYRFPSYADSDNDGIDNTYDLAPLDAAFGGAGILLYDRDLDGIPDYIDLDTDSDGQPDIVEGNDWNFDGTADEITTPLGTDADGDGLDDRFDLVNSTTALRGTSLYMGNAGIMTGDPTPGTRATVQRTLVSGGCTFERDWRCVSAVLPVNHLKLNAVENNGLVTLNWIIMSSMPLNIFEIERSADNVTFHKIGTKDAEIRLNQLEQFSGNDNITAINSSVIYYRIKVIAQNGQVKYSNVVPMRRGKTIQPFSITPNPATDLASVRFYADKDVSVTIKIHDFTGKLVQLERIRATKGNNFVPLTNLSRFSDGVYHVQLMIDNDVQSAKLIIQN